MRFCVSCIFGCLGMRWVLLFGSFISCTLTCLLTFPSGTEIEMEGIGGTTDQSGQLFEWNLCDDPLMQLGCEDGTRICQTTKEGVKKSCGSNLTLEGKSDSRNFFSLFHFFFALFVLSFFLLSIVERQVQ